MATRYAVQSGNFSTGSTWNDGATLGIPTTGDDVFTNGFTVNMDTNATVNSLNNSVVTAQSTRLNPVMTSNTTPSGVASASAGGTTAWDAFDGNTSFDWTPLTGPSQWIQYQFTSPLTIRSYSIFYRGGITGYATNFNLQGSNDGISFTTLDTRTGFAFTTGQYNTLTIAAPHSAYSYYRLNITAVNTGNILLPELTFNEVGITTTVGGTFNFNSGSITVNITNGITLTNGATNMISITAATGTVTISTPLDIQSNNTIGPVILHSGNCNSAINCRFVLGSGNGGQAISKTSPTIMTISCSYMRGGNGTNANSLSMTAGNVIVNGDLYGGNGINTISATGGNVLTVNGNVLGDAVNVPIITTIPFTIVNGSVTGGTTSAISSTTANAINVSGSIIASATANGISSTNASAVVNLAGNLVNVNGKQAVYCQNLFLDNTATTQARFFTFGGSDRTLYSSDTFPNLPSSSNVRFGTTYGPGSGNTGTLRMASPQDVRSGVLTDNTTGSAILSAQSLFDEIATSTNPVAVRLRQASTTDTVGNLLTAFKK